MQNQIVCSSVSPLAFLRFSVVATEKLQPAVPCVDELINQNHPLFIGKFLGSDASYEHGKVSNRVQDIEKHLEPCPTPKCHPIPKCLAWVSCNLARRRYIPFPKLLKIKVNEFWRRTSRSACSVHCFPPVCDGVWGADFKSAELRLKSAFQTPSFDGWGLTDY